MNIKLNIAQSKSYTSITAPYILHIQREKKKSQPFLFEDVFRIFVKFDRKCDPLCTSICGGK